MAITRVGAKPREVSFAERTELIRYIDVDQRLNGNRPASVAFMLNPGEDHLSINSLSVEPMQAIVTYYSLLFRPNRGPIAITKHKLASYNDAARKGGIALHYSAELSS